MKFIYKCDNNYETGVTINFFGPIIGVTFLNQFHALNVTIIWDTDIIITTPVSQKGLHLHITRCIRYVSRPFSCGHLKLS